MKTKDDGRSLHLPSTKRQRSPAVQLLTESAIRVATNESLSFYLHDGFRTYLAAICLNVVLAVIVMIQWPAVQMKALYIAPLPFFSALFIWNAPTDRENLLQPQLYLAVQTLLAALIVFQSPLITIFFFYPLCLQAMLKLKSQKTAALWIGLFALITLANFWHSRELLDVPFSFNAVVVCAGFFFFGTLGSMLVRLKRNREEIRYLLTQLVDARARLEEQAEQSKQLAVASERERLARELHDTLGHRLTVAAVQLEGAHRLMEREYQREQVARKIKGTHRQIIQGLDELRDTLNSMRKLAINADNLASSLQSVVTEFAGASGVVPRIRFPYALPRLSDGKCEVIHRIVQESLTNVQKHGQARNVWLEMDIIQDDTLILTVRNDGRDFVAANNGGHGLQGMKERAAEYSGGVRVSKPVEGGTLVTLRLPVTESESVATANVKRMEHWNTE